MAGISLADAQIGDPHGFVSETSSVLKRTVKSELRSDHHSIVVKFSTSAVVKKLISVSHSADGKVDMSIGIVSNFLPDLEPFSFEGLNGSFGKNGSFVL